MFPYSKITKKTFILAILISILFFSLTEVVNASVWDLLSPATLVATVIKLISYVLNFIVGIFYIIASWLVEIMLGMNNLILDDTNALVKIGWTISRDVANLGFVLAIIIIAIMTILRFESYGVQKMLPKLIAAAILVNFSLVIAGVFINFANVLTNFFIEDRLGASGGFGLATSLADAFGPQRLLLEADPLPPEPGSEPSGFSVFSTATLTAIANLIFGVVFLLIATFVMFVLALMLFIRFLTLSFLLIIAPLSWLFWVLPGLGGYFNKWWNYFIKWTLFAPAVSFFIYLSMASLDGLKKATLTVKGDYSLGLSTVFSQGMQMIVIAGTLLGGIIVAEKLGITGAKWGMEIARKTGTKTREWAGKQTLKAGTLPLRTDLGQKAIERMQTLGQNRGFFLRNLTAPVRQIGYGLATASRKAEELAEKERGKIKNLTFEQKARMYASSPNERKVAILKDFVEERKAIQKEKENSNKKVEQAQKRVERAKETLSKTKPNSVEESKAKADLEKAEQELKDAQKAQNEIVEKYKKFLKAFSLLPHNARIAIKKSGYDLSKLTLPKKAIFRTKKIPLPRLYGERGEYKPGDKK